MTMPRWLSSFIGRKPPGFQKDNVGADELYELVRFSNDTNFRIWLMVEPWAHRYWIEPAANVTVMTDTYPIDEASEIAFSSECVSLYWRRSEILYVFQDGVRLKSWAP